jgi:glutaredoxin
VVVYTREGCGLCRRAEELVAREARRAEVRTVDVDTDPQLQRRYTVRVPVVTVDGEEVAELEVAPGEVRRAVARARRARR